MYLSKNSSLLHVTNSTIGYYDSSWENATELSNFTNSTQNDTSPLELCLTPQHMDFDTFIHCYGVLAHDSILPSILELLVVAFGSFFFNSFVILMILLKPVSLSTFDKIMIGHAIVDGLTGLIDIPIFHVNNFFGYWPLPSFFCYFWASYDNNINTTTSLHMLFMTYVRLRSIQAPKSYKNEFLIKNPIKIMIGIWAFGLGFWTPIVFHFGISEFECEANMSPYYLISVLNFFFWFMPLFGILILSVQIIIILHSRAKIPHKRGKSTRYEQSHVMNLTNSRSYLTNSNSFSSSLVNIKYAIFKRLEQYRMGAQGKFLIIVSSYWLQWIPPCVMVMIDPICLNCVPDTIYGAIYWLTYTVCLSDPIVVLLVNTNVPCFNKKSQM